MARKKSPAPKRAQAKLVCAGCGTDDQKKIRKTAYLLYPGKNLHIHLCYGRGSSGGYGSYHREAAISKVCLRKAREKIAKCPGCLAEGQAPGTLCRGCRDHIARGKEAAQESGEVSWYCLSPHFIPYLGKGWGEDESLREKFARALMKACAAGRFARRNATIRSGIYPSWIGGRQGDTSGSIEDPAAEMSKSQVEGLEEFLALLHPIMELQRLEGKKAGKSILHRLMNGELSAHEVDEHTAECIEKREKAIDELKNPKNHKKKRSSYR